MGAVLFEGARVSQEALGGRVAHHLNDARPIAGATGSRVSRRRADQASERHHQLVQSRTIGRARVPARNGEAVACPVERRAGRASGEAAEARATSRPHARLDAKHPETDGVDAIAWGMALRGVGAGEYCGPWDVMADRVRVSGTKREARVPVSGPQTGQIVTITHETPTIA